MTDSSTRTRYGIANPERVENPLWLSSIAENWSGWRLAEVAASGDRVFTHHSTGSDYRDATPGPFWSWDRFGRTSTPLLDGRIIHVAGEHEDFYDIDFCIYNDVVVEHPDGRVEILLYPKHIFPPTDFHSATLIGRSIFLIGSISYHDLRKPGETQVLKLDTDTLQIEPLATMGESPGWIARHTAHQLSETTIRIVNGTVQTADGSEENTDAFTLDIATLTWRREPPGAPLSAKPWDREELEILEAIEVELAVADEKFPIEPTSPKLLEFFERNKAGNWICTRPIAIAGQNGEVLLIRPRQTFSPTVTLAKINLHEELGSIAYNADHR